MAWVCQDGEEKIFEDLPFRTEHCFWEAYNAMYIILPKGSIKKLIGRELTFSDEPVELV